MTQGYQYETVSGFICEAFGYIPRTGESIKVVLAKANQEENDESKSDQDQKEKHQIFKVEVRFGFFCVFCSVENLLHCIFQDQVGESAFVICESLPNRMSLSHRLSSLHEGSYPVSSNVPYSL